jgi:hypothetical protein
MRSWHRFTVTPASESANVQAAMLAFGAQDDVRFLLKPDVGVFFRTLSTEDFFQFYFTPAAVSVFQPFIDKHRGVACGPPPSPRGKASGQLVFLLGHRASIDLLGARQDRLRLVDNQPAK